MQSYYRRNKSPTKSREDEKQLQQYKECNRLNIHSKEKNDFRIDCHELLEHPACLRSKPENRNKKLNIPIIKIGLHEEGGKKADELRGRKGKAKRTNIGTEYDNSVRLGLNKNNIIRETLENDIKQQRATK